jgi:hypothetical protein
MDEYLLKTEYQEQLSIIMDRLEKLDDCHEHVETIKADHGPMKNLL